MLESLADFTHLLTLHSRASCDWCLGELHVNLSLYFFSRIHIPGLWEKSREIEPMQFLLVDRTSNKMSHFSVSVLNSIQK